VPSAGTKTFTNLFSDELPVKKQCFCYDDAVQNSHCVRATVSTSVIYYEFIESLLSNNTCFLVHVARNPIKIPVKEPLAPIDICHAHRFLTHFVIINICYILLVEDVRRMGEYCITQQSDHNEGSLLMVILKRRSRETKSPCTVSH